MPHKIEGVDLDPQYAYADLVRCPGAKLEHTFEDPNPHSTPRRLTYSGRGWWGCTGCGRSFTSEQIRPEQLRLAPKARKGA